MIFKAKRKRENEKENENGRLEEREDFKEKKITSKFVESFIFVADI